MKILLDQNVYSELAGLLRRDGFAAKHTREMGFDRTPDEDIAQFAAEHDWVVVTHDEDYHRILALQQATKPSVIRFRVFLSVEKMRRLLVTLLHTHVGALGAGVAVSVGMHGVRIHRLPLR